MKDYRTWLKRLIAYSIQSGAYPTRLRLAAAAGCDSSTLSNLTTRAFGASDDLLRRVAYVIGLGELRTAYLLWWRRALTAPRHADRQRARAEMKVIEDALGEAGLQAPLEDISIRVRLGQEDPMCTWLGCVLYELAHLPAFVPDPRRLSTALSGVVPPRAIADTLAALESVGRLARTPEGALRPVRWLLNHRLHGALPPTMVFEETIFRAREALLAGELRAGFALRVGVLPESAVIARGQEVVQRTKVIDLNVDTGAGVVLAGQPEPDPALPPADVVLQLAFALLLLRRPGQDPISWPEPPEPESLGSARFTTGGRLPPDRPLIYDYVHPGQWLRDALRANEGTKRPCTGKALIAAGVLSASRLRCLMLARPGRRNRLDAADVDRLAVCFFLSPVETLFLTRVLGFWYATDVEEKRARLNEIVGMLEAVAERRDEGPAFRARSRLPYLLVRALSGLGVRQPDEFAEAFAISRSEAQKILRDLSRARLPESQGVLLELPDPREDFAAMRLYDDALTWLQRSLQADANNFFYDFFHGAALSTRAEGLAQAQRSLLADLAVPEGPQEGPWVPVVALTLVHPVTRPLGQEADEQEE